MGRGAKTHLLKCNYYKMTFSNLLCEVMEPQEQLSWAVLRRLLRNDSLGKFLRTATAVRLSVPFCKCKNVFSMQPLLAAARRCSRSLVLPIQVHFVVAFDW